MQPSPTTSSYISPFSLDVVYEKTENVPQLQYTITINPTDEETAIAARRQLKDFAAKLKAKKLNVVQSAEGLTVKVVKLHRHYPRYHDKPELGFNASQAYKEINSVWKDFFGSKIQLSNNAIDNITQFISKTAFKYSIVKSECLCPAFPALRGVHVTLMRMLTKGLKGPDLIRKIADHCDDLARAIRDANLLVSDSKKPREQRFLESNFESRFNESEFNSAKDDLEKMRALLDFYQEGMNTEVSVGKNNLIDEIDAIKAHITVATKAHIEELKQRKATLETEGILSYKTIISMCDEEQIPRVEETLARAETDLKIIEQDIDVYERILFDLEKSSDDQLFLKQTEDIGRVKDIDDIPTIEARIGILVRVIEELEESYKLRRLTLFHEYTENVDILISSIKKALDVDKYKIEVISRQILEQQKTLVQCLKSKRRNPTSSILEKQDALIKLRPAQKRLAHMELAQAKSTNKIIGDIIDKNFSDRSIEELRAEINKRSDEIVQLEKSVVNLEESRPHTYYSRLKYKYENKKLGQVSVYRSRLMRKLYELEKTKPSETPDRDSKAVVNDTMDIGEGKASSKESISSECVLI